MKQRVITGIVGLVFLAIIVFIGKYALFGLILIVNAAALYEYITTVSHSKNWFDIIFMALLGTDLIITASYYPDFFFTVFIVSLLLIFMKDIFNHEADAEKTVYMVWGLIYVSLFLALATHILYGIYGIWLFMTIILACIGCDTLAYFIGIRFGKHKLIPQISPKKSVEGSIAGFFGAVLVCVGSAVLRSFFGYEAVSLEFLIISGILIGIAAQFGDLSASMIKRKFGAKDYSNLLPGHGGILDRIDSMLFAFAAVYVLMQFFPAF